METNIPDRLREALQLPGFTKKKLADAAGIHRNTLNGCENVGWNPKLDTLRAIEPHLPARQNAAA